MKAMALEILWESSMSPGSYPSETNAACFTAQKALPTGAHVLLIDDTWVSGSRMRSATLALRRHGAAAVSALSLTLAFRGVETTGNAVGS